MVSVVELEERTLLDTALPIVPPALYFEPAPATAVVGDILTVRLQVDAGQAQVTGGQASIDFDPTVLQVVNAAGQPVGEQEDALAPGSTFGRVLLNRADNARGTIAFAAGTLDGAASGQLTLATIRFRALRTTDSLGTALAFVNTAGRPTSLAAGSADVLNTRANGTVYVVPGQMLSGLLRLHRAAAAPDPSRVTGLVVKLWEAGAGPSPGSAPTAAPLRVVSTTTDQSDALSVGIPELAAGNYDVQVKAAHALSVLRRHVTFPLTGPVDFCTAREGDADENEVVSILDFSILAATFNQLKGQPGFDGRADFDHNGMVTILDFSSLAASFGLQGPLSCP
jgi:hypothetical protein